MPDPKTVAEKKAALRKKQKSKNRAKSDKFGFEKEKLFKAGFERDKEKSSAVKKKKSMAVNNRNDKRY